MKKTLPIFALLLLVAASCSERIDITTNPQSSMLVVNTFISAEASQQTVWLSKTLPYFNGASDVQGVTGAQVWIDNGVNVVELTPNDTAPGQYLTPDNFSVATNQSSSLRVLYDLDGDGVKDEFTATETMRSDVQLDRLILSPMMDTARYFPPFGIGAIFKRNMADECFSADMYYGSPNGRRNMSNYIGSYAADNVPYGMYREQVMYTFSVGNSIEYGVGDTLFTCPFDTIHIRMNSIPKTTLDYLAGAGSEAAGSNPMFSGPPANVPFNIVGKNVIGCFALRNPGNWKSIALPMNVNTLKDTWIAQDGSDLKINIDLGVATYANGASKGKVYFTVGKIDANIRGFYEVPSAEFVAPKQFQMKSYNQFVDLTTGVRWKREHSHFF